jgi:hypothetical protein
MVSPEDNQGIGKQVDDIFKDVLDEDIFGLIRDEQMKEVGGLILGSLPEGTYLDIDYTLTEIDKSNQRDITICVITEGGPKVRVFDVVPGSVTPHSLSIGSRFESYQKKFRTTTHTQDGIIRPGASLSIREIGQAADKNTELQGYFTSVRSGAFTFFDSSDAMVRRRAKAENQKQTFKEARSHGPRRLFGL